MRLLILIKEGLKLGFLLKKFLIYFHQVWYWRSLDQNSYKIFFLEKS